MATAQPKQTAQPRPKAEAQALPLVPGRVFSTKEQEHFELEARTLAAALGFAGSDDMAEELFLRDISVADARRFLVKTFHEVHQHALTPGLPEERIPTAAKVCEHLGVEDAEEAQLVADAMAEVHKREAAAAPQNPASVPNKGVASMSAGLVANLGVAVGAVQGLK